MYKVSNSLGRMLRDPHLQKELLTFIDERNAHINKAILEAPDANTLLSLQGRARELAEFKALFEAVNKGK